ncbi:site-specific integrase [Thauera propionica]|uniref:site-specific integrase n=1 Tax=Thauera propionica TaxID=2019431 RepID=UPI0010558418|nr:site-specific integrase [Thauera propionica]
MNGINCSFSDLQNRRYVLTTSYNVTPKDIYVEQNVVAGSTWESILIITYQQLLADIAASFSSPQGPEGGSTAAPLPQQVRNIASTLHSFLAYHGKTIDSRVGLELTNNFDASAADYLNALEVATSTKRDRRYHLKVIRGHFEKLKAASLGRSPKETSLSQELRRAVAGSGLAPKTLAKQAGISPSALQRWLAGATPNARGLAPLRRLEFKLGLGRDSLTRLVKDEEPRVDNSNATTIGFRQDLRLLIEDRYAIHESDFNANLTREWKSLFDYKTSIAPQFERSARGVWRLIPKKDSASRSALVCKGSQVCPSADVFLIQLRSFLGFLIRPVEAGGWGLPSDQAQTLSWLAHPEAINAFLEFKTERAKGVKHTGHAVFCQYVASLLRDGTGYLRQRCELRHSLPEDYRPLDDTAWKLMCEQTQKVVKAWRKCSTGIRRAPQDPIAFLLDLDEPLLPVLEGIKRIERDAASAAPGSKQQAILKRDALLLALLLSNPLRLRSMQSLTISSSGAGSVYRTDKGYRLRLTSSQLKNGESGAGKRYDVAIAPWVTAMLDEYIEEYRPVLAMDPNDTYLLLSSRSTGLWTEMGRQVLKLTKRYIRGCSGISPHGFRHLVATAFLKKNPNGFLQVAELLNDRLSTVMQAYAHLKRDDSLTSHNSNVDALFVQLKKN